MCGIAGVIDWRRDQNQAERGAALQAMRAALQNRGPDQQGLYQQGSAGLAHTRLSVVDLQGGRQPMALAWGQEHYILVYNGELYNTPEVRKELAALGHEFVGHSDTEVLLHAYAQWGPGCVGELNGIFAFAVWESARQRLFVARDRIGVKPFFYIARDQAFLFASELKGLLAHPSVSPDVDAEGLAEIMLLGPGRTPGCGVFRGVAELPPAHCGFFDRDGLRVWAYWQLRDREHRDTFAQTVETVRELVTDAITRQLVSDVPVGAFLSGGLDSSIIASLADSALRAEGEGLHTFSVGYRDNERYFRAGKFQPESDDAYIRRMNEALAAIHHQVTLDTEPLVDALFAAVDARDLPGMADVDASLLLFCREIKRHVTVALSGECADEIFGGYPWYRDAEIRARYGFPWAQSTDYRADFLLPGVLGAIDPREYVDQRYRDTLAAAHALPDLTGTERRMREMTALNLRWFMQTLLDRKDRMSMAAGLEVRVPFCDYRIAEYLYSVPWDMKDHQGQEKGLLRAAVQGLLPEEVRLRKKSPYPKTHHPDYLRAVRRALRKVLDDPAAPLLQIARKEALEAMLDADNPTPWYGQLMTTPQTIAYFLQVNYWLKAYKVRLV
ncbi:MAG: asparagine synthase (glutamine-hydrolyzing) [Oscillospiraceae bacterium]|jgi:asparagine synthase (glutamine-hydrolysing)|nr:asparagine synthase (glutamine-hydrolyzing) [Oscillospiraceae bacterium]